MAMPAARSTTGSAKLSNQSSCPSRQLTTSSQNFSKRKLGQHRRKIVTLTGVDFLGKKGANYLSVKIIQGKSMKMRFFKLAILLALPVLFCAGTVSGATITWTNSASGNWSGTNNWSPNRVPGPSDTAVITNAGNL